MKNVGGTTGSKRRGDVLEKIARLHPLPAEQRASFTWFKTEWDRLCTEKHGNAWPDLFLRKVKGVIDKLPADPNAFSVFLFDEQRKVFKDHVALVVPGCIKRTSSN